MPQPNADRNLLIGVLALQLDFIDRDQLVASMQAWIADKSRSLDNVLLGQHAIDEDTRALLVALVDKHLEKHGGSAEQSLASVSSLGSAKDVLEKLGDDSLRASLVQVAANRKDDDPYATLTHMTTGEFTSKGQRFRVLRTHAAGGLGEVFVAHDVELSREVALKEIKGKYADDAASRARFMLEAEVTGGLEHPGIVPVYGLGTYADGRPFYAMRFIRGDSLERAIERYYKHEKEQTDPGQRRLELRKLLGRLIDVCYAIEYAHKRGVLHRDLKPGNIMLGKYGETLVVDWGLAKTADDANVSTLEEPALRPTSARESEATRQGSQLGTPAYMSPEQAAGRLDLLTPASDVYSLGATLYEMLTGKVSVSPAKSSDWADRIQKGDIPKPSALRADVPKALEAICFRAMAIDPRDRYQSAAALAEDIENWLADEPVTAWTEPLRVRITRWLRRHKTFAASAAAAVIVALLVLSVSLAMLKQKNSIIDAQRRRAEANLAVAKNAVDTMLTEVADEKLANVPQFEQTRRELLLKAKGFYGQLAVQEAQDYELRLEAAVAWRRIADIDRIEHNIQESEAHYRSSIKRLRDLAKQYAADSLSQQELARSYNGLGWLLQEHQPKSAIAELNAAIEIQRELAQQASSEEAVQQLARALYNRGIAHYNDGELRLAIDDYRAAIKLLDSLLDSAQQAVELSTCRQELARCHNNLANALKRTPSANPAADPAREYEAAIQLTETLASAFPDNREYREELATYSNNLANLLLDQERNEEALQRNSTAIEQWKYLNAALPTLRSELGSTLNTQAAILQVLKQGAASERSALEAELLFRGLAEDFPHEPQYQARLGMVLYTQATLKYYGENFGAAKRLLSEALALHLAALQALPENPQFRQQFSNDCFVLALVFEALMQPAEAEAVRSLTANPASMPDAIRYGARLLGAAIRDVESDGELGGPDSGTAQNRLENATLMLLQLAVRGGYVDAEQLTRETIEGGAFFHVKHRDELAKIKDSFESNGNSRDE